MNNIEQKIIKPKVGLLELSKQLGSVSQACKTMGYSRDSFYRFKKLYKQRHKIENMFGWLKDWRRIGTRYDRCAHTFMSAIFIAVIVIFYLNRK